MSSFPFVLAAMVKLVPGADHTEPAAAVATVVDAEQPLFAGDTDRRKTAGLVVAIAYRESTFRNNAVSKTNDFCMMQVNRRPDLADDIEACVRVGVTMLRESMRMCPAHPIAFYAEGPRGCSSARAQRISRDRMAIAKWLVANIAVPAEETPLFLPDDAIDLRVIGRPRLDCLPGRRS